MTENSNYDDQDFIPPGEETFVPPPVDPNPPPLDQNNDKKWVLPLVALGCGCICLPLIAIVLGLAGLGNTFRRLYQSTGTYQVYQLAAQEVETDATVREVLGNPVEAGWTSQSKEFYGTNNVGQVCMRFNVTGGDRSGSAYAEATSTQGAWQLHQLTVIANGEAEPVAIVPLEPTEQPLCPDFDDPDENLEEPGLDEPDQEAPLPGQGTEI